MSRRNKSLDTYIYFLIFWFVFRDVITNSLLQYSAPLVMIGLKYFTILMRMVLAGIAGFYLVTKKHSGKYLVEIFVYTILLSVTLLVQRTFAFFDLFFISLFFQKYLDYKKTVRAFLYAMVFSVMVVVSMSFLNMFPEFSVIRETGRERVTFGFPHPNVLGHNLLFLCALYLMLRDTRINVCDLGLVSLISLWLYIYPNSITPAAVLFLIVMIILTIKFYYFISKREIMKWRWLRIFSVILIPIITAGVYFIVVKGFGNDIILDISTTLVSRIQLSLKGIELYGIHGFNLQKIEFTGTAQMFFGLASEYFVIDCLYIYIFVVFGFIPSLFYLGYYMKCVKKCMKDNNTILWIIMMSLLLFSITESSMVSFKTSFIFCAAMCNYNACKAKNGAYI